MYVEKPLTHTVYEARQLAEAAREHGVATQMGNHGHAGEGVRRVCEILWSGEIGQVREVHAADASGEPDRLDDLVSLLRADGVTIGSTDRGNVAVTGRSPAEIGAIARDHGIALTRLVPERRSLEDVFMELTADAVEYHGHGTASPTADAPVAA